MNELLRELAEAGTIESGVNVRQLLKKSIPEEFSIENCQDGEKRPSENRRFRKKRKQRFISLHLMSLNVLRFERYDRILPSIQGGNQARPSWKVISANSAFFGKGNPVERAYPYLTNLLEEALSGIDQRECPVTFTMLSMPRSGTVVPGLADAIIKQEIEKSHFRSLVNGR